MEYVWMEGPMENAWMEGPMENVWMERPNGVCVAGETQWSMS